MNWNYTLFETLRPQLPLPLTK